MLLGLSFFSPFLPFLFLFPFFSPFFFPVFRSFIMEVLLIGLYFFALFFCQLQILSYDIVEVDSEIQHTIGADFHTSHIFHMHVCLGTEVPRHRYSLHALKFYCLIHNTLDIYMYIRSVLSMIPCRAVNHFIW